MTSFYVGSIFQPAGTQPTNSCSVIFVWSVVPLLPRTLLFKCTVNASGDSENGHWCCDGLSWVLIPMESVQTPSSHTNKLIMFWSVMFVLSVVRLLPWMLLMETTVNASGDSEDDH